MTLTELISELKEEELDYGSTELVISYRGDTTSVVSGIYEDAGAIVILGGG